jgi:hypothetical protein
MIAPAGTQTVPSRSDSCSAAARPSADTPAREYLRSHAVDLNLAAEVGVTADHYSISFPYARADGTHYYRRRTFSDGICRQPKGELLSMFWPLGVGARVPVILCEGEADTLAAASVVDSSDHPLLSDLCPVGVPGASFPATRVARDLRAAGVGRAYVVFDADEAGRKATARVSAELERKAIGVVPVELPDGTDLSDFLVAADNREEALGNLLADFLIVRDEAAGALAAQSVRERLQR